MILVFLSVFSFLSVSQSVTVVLCMQLHLLILRTCWKILLNVICLLSTFGLESLGNYKEGKLPAVPHAGSLLLG